MQLARQIARERTADRLEWERSLDDVLMLLAEEFLQIGKLLDRETPRGVAETTV